MIFVKNTYKTIKGTKEIVEIPNKKKSQWIIYKDEKPTYYVDFYALEEEANAIMNSLVLCGKRKIKDVLQLINARNNINLSIPKISRFSSKVKSEPINLQLEPLPLEWIDYSL